MAPERTKTLTSKRLVTRERGSQLLVDLNPEQRRAVTHESGPLLIVAGAGTGKTTVITRRIAWLILEKKVPTDGILALTFTEKAATEMEERVDRLLPYGYVDLWISTFHSFCERVLKRHALDIGLPNDFTLIGPTAAWLLMRRNLDRFNLDYYRPRGNPTKFLHALHEHFSRCKDEAVGPEEYLAYAKEFRLDADAEHSTARHSEGAKATEESHKNVRASHDVRSLDRLGMTNGNDASEAARIAEVANAYHVYQQLLLEEGALDFGDLLVSCLKLFRERPAILARYRKQFQHILVDEFQDTNWAQYEIVKLLAPGVPPLRVRGGKGELRTDRNPSQPPLTTRGGERAEPNLTVVADDDQAIYAWRGASMSNVLHFKEDYPMATNVTITTNYRSRQDILNAAYRLISVNDPNRLEVSLGIDKKLTAAEKGSGIIEVLHAPDAAMETRMVVERILARKNPASENVKHLVSDTPGWNDFAILVRANRQAEQFLPALNAAGIPYQFLASRGLYRKPIILDVLAHLQLLDDYHESPACYRVLNIPTFGFTYDELLTLTNWAGRKAKSLFEVLREARVVPGLTPVTLKKIEHVLGLIAKHAELARTAPVREVVLAFLEESGILKSITDEETAEDHATVGFLNQFWKRIEAFEESADEPTVKRFMEMIDLEREAGDDGSLPTDPNEGPEAVKVLTVHAAKGLEFRYVFIVNLVEQRFPATDRSEPIEIPIALTKVIVPEGDVHMAEERRLFYVALTRAKEGLWLSYADDYGGVRKRKPSRFLTELGLESGVVSREDRSSFKSHASRLKTHDFGITPHAPIPPSHALPSKLSFTQLKAYQTCHWQYHYAHVLRVPIRGRYVFSFGQTMHIVLQQLFNRVLEQSSTQQGDLFGVAKSKAQSSKLKTSPNVQIPKLEDLLEIYERAWIDDWYESKRQAKEYFENGKRILKEFYAKHAAEGWPSVHATEQPFTVKFGTYSVMGKVDRIDQIANEGVEIIDYKTGKPKEKLDADDKTQLLIYQVAATQALGLTPKILSYYYLEDNSKISFLGTSDELERLAATVADIGQRIASGDFASTPGRHCQYCDFKNICPFAQ